MTYLIVTGITLKSGRRLEPGEVYNGKLPKWVVEQGHAVKEDDK